MRPGLLQTLYFLLAGAGAAMAQPLSVGKLPESPAAAIQQAFGAVSRDVYEVVPNEGEWTSGGNGVTFYMKPSYVEGLCKTRSIRVAFGDAESLETHEVYYWSGQSSFDCAGPIATHKLFIAESWSDRIPWNFYHGKLGNEVGLLAWPLLRSLIAQAASDAPLSLEDKCYDQRPGYFPPCAATELRTQLSQLKTEDLTYARDVGWSDRARDDSLTYELSVGREWDGHWLLRVDFRKKTEPSITYEINNVQMRWVGTGPVQ